MEPLHNQTCEPCRSDSSPLSNEESRRLLTDIPGWKIEQHDGVYRLVKIFNFRTFKGAFQFAAKVTDIAEEENHHPLITVEWGKTTIQWWTHSIAGLHRNDFIMAAKSDQAANR
jgi:4a-hydroxytetrahydrobiopterin dehydratase